MPADHSSDHAAATPGSSDISPGFLVLHSHRLESLRDVLVQWLRAHPLAPLEDEVVLVQSNGMAQWLKAALAADPEPAAGAPAAPGAAPGLGICAAVRMQFPARFFWQAYRAVLGAGAVPQTSPFDKERLRWRILRLLPGLLPVAAFAPLRDYLSDDPDGRKAWQLAVQVADLFDQYQVYRADWLTDWSAGNDALRLADAAAGPLPLPAREAWQPLLWRALEHDILTGGAGAEGSAAPWDAVGAAAGHRAALQARFLSALRQAETRPRGLPRRLIVWGFSTLPLHVLEGLAALGRHVQVILAVVNPCQFYWADLTQPRARLRHARKAALPALLREEQLGRHANPLLLAWGQQGRDYLRGLEQFDDPDSYRARFQALGQRIDLFDDDTPADTLLAQVQQAVRDLEPVPDDPAARLPVAPGDRSLRFQVAHSRLREVEALHDHLLALFAELADSERPLRPQDIAVMVPDIRLYAPLVQAVFASGDGTALPFTILDRPQRGEQPLLTALDWLLGLPEARCTSAELWDLLDVPAVQARFGLAAADLPRLRQWFEAAGARWGLDAGHRARWRMPDGLEQNTWRFALRRLLLGYAVGDAGALPVSPAPDGLPATAGDITFAGVLPHGDIGALDAAGLGPMAAVLEALAHWSEALAEARASADWALLLDTLLDAFFLPADEHDGWLLEQLRQALGDWLAEAADAGAATLADGRAAPLLSLAVVRELWLARLDEASMSQRFLSGAIHVATLMPMRAIPFRVVCILGLNDGEFPRQRPPVDFDLMREPGLQRPGDRSRREDDRYLMLEALLSARERLLLSWVGRSARSNQPLPPSLLVAQLRDYVAAGWVAADDPAADLLARLTTSHALQPFSERYFTGTALTTHASHWRAALDTLTPPEQTALPLPEAWPTLPLARLQAWLRDPAAVFYGDRLGVVVRDGVAAVPDHEPFAVAGLDRYQAAEDLLAALHEPDPARALAGVVATRAGRGEWPLAGFADAASQDLSRLADEIWQASADWRRTAPLPPLPLLWQGEAGAQPLTVSEVVQGVRQGDAGPCLWWLTPSALHNSRGQVSRWRALLMPWLQHILLAVCGQAMPTRVISAGGSVTWAPLTQAAALAWWHHLLDAWADGQCQALPFEADTAFAAAAAWREADAPEVRVTRMQAAATPVYDGAPGGRFPAAARAPLGWLWPDAEALMADGRFLRLSEQLFLPIVQATLAGGGEGGGAASDREGPA